MPAFLTKTRARLFVLLTAISLAQLAIGVTAAMLVSDLFRAISDGQEVAVGRLVLFGGAIVLVALTELARRVTTEALGLDYARSVRLVLLERMLRRPYHGTRPRSRGSQLLPFVGDLTALRQWWSDGVARGSSAAFIALGLCGWIGWQHRWLGLAMGLMAIGYLAITALAVRPYAAATRQQRNLRGTMTAIISDRIAAAHAIIGMGGLKREVNGIDRRIEKMNRASLRRASWSGVMRGLAATVPLAGALLLLANAGSHGIAPHEIVGLLTLTGLLGGALADIARAAELAIPARISGARIRSRIDEIEPIRTSREPRSDGRHRPLRLDGFRLATGHEPFDAKLAKGDVVLIDGAPGSGKSKLLAMIAGVQPVAAGSIRIAGREASRLGQKRRREHVGIAARWVPLIQSSLAANLGYRLRKGTDRQGVPALMAQMGLAHLIKADGKPAELRIRDQGSGLAASVIAAVRIVRAAVGDPVLLVLDDADRDLTEDQTYGLAELVAGWRGVVVMTTDDPGLRALANHHWTVGASGISDVELPAKSAEIHELAFDGR
ncbi:MAG: ABC transporter ATP-binding protein [Sphingomonadaceae bacterium]